jgi:hypothetical protein
MSEPGMAFRLDPQDRRQIEKLRKKEKDARIYSRYLALLWLDDGKSVEEVAALLDRLFERMMQLHPRGCGSS